MPLTILAPPPSTWRPGMDTKTSSGEAAEGSGLGPEDWDLSQTCCVCVCVLTQLDLCSRESAQSHFVCLFVLFIPAELQSHFVD